MSRIGSASGGVATHGAVTVTDAATKIPPSNLRYRRAIAIRNESMSANIWIGNSDVTIGNGWRIGPYETQPLDCNMNLQWYGICETGQTAEIRYLEIIND